MSSKQAAPLQVALASLQRENQRKRAERTAAKERVKREVIEAAVQVNRSLLATVNQDVATVHENQRQIEAKSRLVEEQTRRFVSQTSKWMSSYDKLDAALRSLGNVGEWAKGVEAELAAVTKSLEFVAENEPDLGR